MEKHSIDPESLMKTIQEMDSKNLCLLNQEKIILDIYAYLQDKSLSNSNKIIILKYLSKCLDNIPTNVDLLMNLELNKKSIYHIIIYECIVNCAQKEYAEELKNLFAIIIKHTSYNKYIYQYIISFVSNYMNKKMLLLNDNKDINIDQSYFEEEINEKEFNSNHLLAVLELIEKFFVNGREVNEPYNYFYFNGQQNDKIIINNSNNILDIKNTIFILLFINLIDLKLLQNFENFSLLNIQLNNEKKIAIYISDKGKNSDDSVFVPYSAFSTKQINQVLIKINKGSKMEILINNKPTLSEISINETKIESLELFNGFIGSCSSIILYKAYTKEIYYPKFFNNDSYKKGIYKEELFTSFVKANIMKDIDDQNNGDKTLTNCKDSALNEIKIFLEKNLISIYIPTRTENAVENKNIILKDSINDLDAIFNINSYCSGIHSHDKVIKAFYNIGTINHLLPIIELVNKETNLANTQIFEFFMNIISYIFEMLSHLFKLFDLNTQFFYYLSHFLEKLPKNLYGDELNYKLKSMAYIFFSYKDDASYQLASQQFVEHILLNETILFKFSFELQKNLINQIIALINERSKTKLFINIDIIKIINILLYYDSQRYNKYCCLKHAEYFNDAKEKGVMSPELNTLMEPVINLLKELFKRYLNQFNNVSNDIKTMINSNQSIKDYNLDNIFDLLTFDISPCLQLTILTMFFELRAKSKELYELNKNGKFRDILLFLLKTSLFEDIKSIALDFIMIFYHETFTNPTFKVNNNDIRLFIEWNILPNYLFIDDKGKNIQLSNVSGEIETGKYNEYFFINNIKYNYLFLSAQQKKLNINYNKNKLISLINNLFDKIYNNFSSCANLKMNLNILVKIASKGDVLLTIKLLDKIKSELSSKSRGYLEKQTEIFSNNNLLHYLLETCFRFYLLSKNNLKNESNYGINFPANINDKDKNTYIKDILEKSNNLLITIFNNNIYKLDYLITWSKYYYEIIEDNNNFALIRDFLYDLIFQKLIETQNEIFQPNISSNKVQRATLYFYNIIFEYYTYYKIRPSLNNAEIKDIDILYEEISTPFKIRLLSELKKEYKNHFTDDIYNVISKLPFYIFMKKVNDFFRPMWFDEKKIIKNDKDFFKTYIHHKHNTFINDLEFMFYSFADVTELQQKEENINIYGNKGIPLVIILFHHFTIFLTLITDKKEFKEIIESFRLFLSLIIISSSTLVISKGKQTTSNNPIKLIGESNKTNWPSEEQYKSIQRDVHLILFNTFHFLYYKVAELNLNIKKYEGKQERLDYVYNLTTNKKYVYDTICYFLRLLNSILKERKQYDEDKKKHKVKAVFGALKKMIVTKTEGIILTGPYLFISELYTKCFLANKSNNNENPDNIIINKKTFMDDIPIYNINDMSKDGSNNYAKLYQKIESCGNAFMNDENIKKYLDENIVKYQRVLFPFLKFIIERKNLAQNIIPIYDNSTCCNQNYNSICLLPNYYPNFAFDKCVSKNIIKFNENLNDKIRFAQMKSYFDNYEKIRRYYKIKQKLFTFNGLWSKNEFFYNKNKYALKYKILNHLTEDYTKIFITPIIDMEYYLPKFSSFNTKELFRPNDGKIIPLQRVTDLSSDSIDKSNDAEEEEKKEDINDEKEEEKKEEEKKEEEKETTDLSLMKDKKEDELNSLYLLKKINYKFVENLNKEEKDIKRNYELFQLYVNTINNININDYCSVEESCLIKPSYHIKGVFYNNQREIGFYGFDKNPLFSQGDYDQERKACFGSVFKTQKRKYDGYHIRIPYNQIALVLKRRYFFKTVALEIFTLKNKSYYFKFNGKNFKKIYENIRHKMKSTIEDIQIEYSKVDSKIGFINNNDNNNLFINTSLLMYKKKDMNLKNLYEKWANWEMSTFKFLMLINLYASRSLNDVNQYPVFPWIITNYTEEDYNLLLKDQALIRPFDVPMGMMTITEGAENRKNNFIEHWKSMEEDEEKSPNYDRYGTHYSTSLYVSYYLVRSFPFSNIRIELQGSKFDDPNRLFLAMNNSFNTALTQKTDLRELIPELFCFPEMFYNSNNLNLGELSENIEGVTNESSSEKKTIVNDVGMPKWSNNDGYTFIQKHRELLESPEISEKINEWFNIIFGSKQKGSAAKKINNLFLDQTYDDFEEQHEKSSLEDKINQYRMVEFGVTPNQIFKSDVNKRKSYNEIKHNKQLLYNTTTAIKNGDRNNKFLNFEEIDCDFNEEKPYRIFDFKKEGFKKWRIYILTKKSVKIFTKKKEKIDIDEENNENNLKENKNLEKKELMENVLHRKSKDITSKVNISRKDDVKLPEFKYRLNTKENYCNCSVIFGKGLYIVLGGYWNGNIVIKSLDYKTIAKGKDLNKTLFIYSTNELSPITKIIIDESETYAICANKAGRILVYVINPEKKYVWNLSMILSFHKTEITSLAISDNLNIFISCSKDGNCMLYSLPRIKLFNSWYIESQETGDGEDIFCSNIIIFHTPLPCFIFYIQNLNYLYVYSINGKFLKKHKLNYKIVNNGITKYIDYQYKDYLMIYNSNDRTIDIHRGIDFEFVTKSPVINYNFIDFVLCQALDHALILVENANENKKSEAKYKILVLKDKENDLKWK